MSRERREGESADRNWGEAKVRVIICNEVSSIEEKVKVRLEKKQNVKVSGRVTW